MTKLNRLAAADYFRNFIFGVEDSLVSTVGLLSGVAAANLSHSSIILAGTVLIFVEAFSMAVGSYLSESAAEEYLAGHPIKARRPIGLSLAMFGSYFVSGLIPLFPYLVFDLGLARLLSILFSLAALFLLGLISARFLNHHWFKLGFRMLILGGLAIAVGSGVGTWVNSYF